MDDGWVKWVMGSRFLWHLVPWRVRQNYWKRHQCPAWDSVTGLRCVRSRHAGFEHRDGRGDRLAQWTVP